MKGVKKNAVQVKIVNPGEKRDEIKLMVESAQLLRSCDVNHLPLSARLRLMKAEPVSRAETPARGFGDRSHSGLATPAQSVCVRAPTLGKGSMHVSLYGAFGTPSCWSQCSTPRRRV